MNQPAYLFLLSSWHSLVVSQCRGASAVVGLIIGSHCPQLSPLPLHPRCCPGAAAAGSVLQWLQIGWNSWDAWMWMGGGGTQQVTPAVCTFPAVTSATRQETTSRGPEQTAGGGNNQKQLERNLLEPLETRGAWSFKTCTAVFCKHQAIFVPSVEKV